MKTLKGKRVEDVAKIKRNETQQLLRDPLNGVEECGRAALISVTLEKGLTSKADRSIIKLSSVL